MKVTMILIKVCYLSDDEGDDDVDKGMLPVVLSIPDSKYICTGEKK